MNGPVVLAFVVVLAYLAYRFRKQLQQMFSGMGNIAKNAAKAPAPNGTAPPKPWSWWKIGSIVLAACAFLLLWSYYPLFNAHRMFEWERGNLLLAVLLPLLLLLAGSLLKQSWVGAVGGALALYMVLVAGIGWLTPDNAGCSRAEPCVLSVGSDGSTTSTHVPIGMGPCFDASFWVNIKKLKMKVSYRGGAEQDYDCTRTQVIDGTCHTTVFDTFRFVPEKHIAIPSFFFLPAGSTCEVE